MRLLTAFCIVALAVAIATPASAAVQSIKISGSVEERAIVLRDFDLKKESLESTIARFENAGVAGSGLEINDDDDSFVLSTVKVGIDADLTDNVAASIILANQLRWGDAAGVSDIDLNQAYVTLKEFFYSPLTLRIGRQPLLYGQGLIVGPGLLRDPSGAFPQPTDTVYDPLAVANRAATAISGPMGAQYSISNYYDAIRATVDLDPWAVDVVYAIINETDTGIAGASDDETLTGVNVGYAFGDYNATLEGYYFYNRDEQFNSNLGYGRDVNRQAANTALDGDVPGVGNRVYEENIVHVLGLRGDIEPVDDLTLSGEVAFQLGELMDDTGPNRLGDTLERDREALAANVEGNYTWREVSYQPNLGAGYVFFSGEEAGNSGDFEAWDPMFKGKFFSSIRDYLAGDQTDYRWSNLYITKDEDDTAGNTNSHIVFVDGGLKPLEDLTLKARYLHFWFHERPVDGRNKNIGDEVDASLVYDYTEDVQFNLTGAWFIPGKYYDGAAPDTDRSKDLASEVTGSVRVAF